MAALLTTVTTDTTGASVAVTGPTTVKPKGVMDNCIIFLQFSDDGIAWDTIYQFRNKLPVTLNMEGSYFLRCITNNSGASTSVSVNTTT